MTRDQLKQRYRDLGLRAYQVARLCGVSQTTEARWGNRDVTPTGTDLPPYADALLAALEHMTPDQREAFLVARGASKP